MFEFLRGMFGPKEKTMEEQQQEIANVRCRAMEIQDKLDAVTPLLDAFPEGTRAVYQDYLKKFSEDLSAMKTSDENTEEVDDFLKTTITKLGKAAKNADAGSMRFILNAMDTGLEYRTAMVNDAEIPEEEEMQSEFEDLSLLIDNSQLITKKEKEIQKENQKLDKYKEENAGLKTDLEKFEKEYPDVVEDVNAGKKAGEKAQDYIVLLDKYKSSNMLVEAALGRILNLHGDLRSLVDSVNMLSNNREIGRELEIREQIQEKVKQIYQEVMKLEEASAEFRKETREMLERFAVLHTYMDPSEVKRIQITAAQLAEEKKREKNALERRNALRLQQEQEEQKKNLEKETEKTINMTKVLLEEVK